MSFFFEHKFADLNETLRVAVAFKQHICKTKKSGNHANGFAEYGVLGRFRACNFQRMLYLFSSTILPT